VTEYIGQYDLDSNGITRPRIHVDVRRVHVHFTWATCSRVLVRSLTSHGGNSTYAIFAPIIGAKMAYVELPWH